MDDLEARAGRGVIGSAFQLLDHIRDLEPARLVDLATVSGIPRPTVFRLLNQLIRVGAVRRVGTRYGLGPSLVGYGEHATPERRLRIAASRPLAELAAATGAAVALTADMGDTAITLTHIEGRRPLSINRPVGVEVLEGSAQAAVHGIGIPRQRAAWPALAVDTGKLDPDISCVAAAIPLPGGDRAAVACVIAAPRLPHGLLVATRATGARIAQAVANQVPATGERPLNGLSVERHVSAS
jgi:DNA-binding IclR family transcriptional regulator